MPVFFLRLASLALALSLAGCSTLETAADHARDFATRHPVITAVGTAVVVGGAVAAFEHHRHHSGPPCWPLTGTVQGAVLERPDCVPAERPVCGRTAC